MTLSPLDTPLGRLVRTRCFTLTTLAPKVRGSRDRRKGLALGTLSRILSGQMAPTFEQVGDLSIALRHSKDTIIEAWYGSADQRAYKVRRALKRLAREEAGR